MTGTSSNKLYLTDWTTLKSCKIWARLSYMAIQLTTILCFTTRPSPIKVIKLVGTPKHFPCILLNLDWQIIIRKTSKMKCVVILHIPSDLEYIKGAQDFKDITDPTIKYADQVQVKKSLPHVLNR